MNTFRYKISFEDDTNNFQITTRQGILAAEDFEEAIRKLCRCYGNIFDVFCLRMIADSSVIEMDEKAMTIIDKVEKEWVW